MKTTNYQGNVFLSSVAAGFVKLSACLRSRAGILLSHRAAISTDPGRLLCKMHKSFGR